MTKNKKALKNESIKKFDNENIAQFVCYGNQKAPVNPITGKLTDITNPVNRWDYETASNGTSNFKNIAGVGIVLGKNPLGNLCGIDIDNCINDKGKIANEALEIINLLDSYAEFSPSGKGLHCLFFALKNGSICKNSNLDWCKCLEIYDQNRYFTLTGNCINNKPIGYRQSECDRIYKKFFEIKENLSSKSTFVPMSLPVQNTDAEKLKRGLKYNKKLRGYWNGQRPSMDESSNDLGFLSCLMFWTNKNINLSIETLVNSPYAQMKDAEHKKKMNRKDYLLRTAHKCLQNSIGRNHE